MADYILLNTGDFDVFIAKQKNFKDRYAVIRRGYNKIIQDLMEKWDGAGAEAFEADASEVHKNIVGIEDILTTMCDTLTDCYEVFEECDRALMSNNKEAAQDQ